MISIRRKSDELVCWDHATLRRRGELPAGTGVTLDGQFVFYAYTNTCFGGRRQWFSCPGCRTPRRVLYGWKPRCRECIELVYASQYAGQLGRSIDKMLKIRNKLGGRGLVEPFPLRPKGMHWSTYRGLQREDERRVAAGLANFRGA